MIFKKKRLSSEVERSRVIERSRDSEDKQFRFWIFLMLFDLAVCMMLLDIFLYNLISATLNNLFSVTE